MYTNREEDIAAKYLRLLGFSVLSRNDRRFGAELDFLCARHDCDEFFIFEIKKVRRSAGSHYPKVSQAQVKRLRSAALRLQASAEKFLSLRAAVLIVNEAAGSVEMIADIF